MYKRETRISDCCFHLEVFSNRGGILAKYGYGGCERREGEGIGEVWEDGHSCGFAGALHYLVIHI